jgi:hypothetical protein
MGRLPMNIYNSYLGLDRYDDIVKDKTEGVEFDNDHNTFTISTRDLGRFFELFPKTKGDVKEALYRLMTTINRNYGKSDKIHLDSYIYIRMVDADVKGEAVIFMDDGMPEGFAMRVYTFLKVNNINFKLNR